MAGHCPEALQVELRDQRRPWREGLLPAVCMFAIVAAGCSTLEVQDSYAIEGTDDGKLLEFSDQDVSVGASINPRTLFYSAGVLGLPVIPTVVRPAGNEIEVGLYVSLRRDRHFTLAARPCFSTDSGAPLCPRDVQISAYGLRENEQGQREAIARFYDAERKPLRLRPTTTTPRIEQGLIYRHYSYLGTPAFDLMNVQVTYSYQCEGACPQKLAFNTNGLVELDSIEIEGQNYKLERKRRKDYGAVVPVQ